MAYEFLKETTYSKDALANGDLLETISSMLSASQVEDTEPGQPDEDETVDEDLIKDVDLGNDEPEDTTPDEPEDEEEDEEDGMIDPDIMTYLFSNSQDAKPVSEGSPLTNVGNTVNLPNVPNGLEWLNRKTKNVNLQGLNGNISKYLNTLPENLRKALVATSGNDDKHMKGSKHYNSNAIDLRYNEEAYKYMMNDPIFKQMGLKMANPNHGTAPHLHIETMKYGGGTLLAQDEQTQRIGLNDPNYSEAFFPLKGTNTFRGLDNNRPVAVTDGSKYKILVGKNDTAKFKGNVYEKKL